MKIDITFTEEELKKFIAYKEAEKNTCQGIDCLEIDCKDCPLHNLNDDEALEYIKNHLE